MFKQTLFFLFCLASINSIITKKRMDNFIELRATEGDLTATNEYCAQLDNLNQCQYCYASFLVQNKCLVPNKKVDHCLSYSADGYCELCQFNFGLKEGKCVKITIPNCIETEKYDLDRCASCADGNLISTDGQCTGKTKCGIKYCSVCGVKGDYQYCSLCQNKYVLAVGEDTEGKPYFECIPETGIISNCAFVSSDKPGECMQCSLNYYMNEAKQCVKSSSYEMDMYGKNIMNLIASFFVTLLFFQLNFN